MDSNTTDSITVSICCITYNHEKYIAQAIESFLMQKTTFPYEIIIGEDCSTDRTQQIVREYADRYPQLIKVVTSDKNVGPWLNAMRTRADARGEYIALCEGDDYWISPHKLQKQVDLMKSDGNCILCGSRAFTWRDGDETPYSIVPDQPIETLDAYGLEELFRGRWWLKNCTRIYPRRILESVPSLCRGDWLTILYIAGKWPGARVGFVNEVLAVYREHPGGIYSSSSVEERVNRDLAALQQCRPVFSGKYGKLIDRYIQQRHRQLASLPGASLKSRLAHWSAALRHSPFSLRLWRAFVASLLR